MDELRDTLAKYRALVNGFDEFMDEAAVTLSTDAIQLVHSRIVDTGIDADGKPLKPYSERDIPKTVFVDNGTISASKAKGLPPFVSYLDVKKALGRYRGHRDMMLTGDMWKNTGLTAKEVTKGGFVVTVAGKQAETQHKLDRNSDIVEKNVLTLSKEEEKTLAEDLNKELQDFMDRTLE